VGVAAAEASPLPATHAAAAALSTISFSAPLRYAAKGYRSHR